MANFTDPTGGVGYAFGAKLPSAHMTQLAADNANAMSGQGGSYLLTSDLEILEGSGFSVVIDSALIAQLTVTNIPIITAYTRTTWQPQIVDVTTGWTINGSGLPEQTSSGAQPLRWWLTDLVDGASFSNINVRYDGAASHPEDPVDGGSSPITMPEWTWHRYDRDAGTRTALLSSVADTNNGASAYEAPHDISDALGSVSAGNKLIDLGSYSYALEITPESGAGYVAAARVLGVEVSQSVSEIRV